MKRIKINEINLDKISNVIDSAEGASRTRKISASILLSSVVEQEKILKKVGIYKKYQEGIKISFTNNPGTFASSYNGSPQATYVDVERLRSGWFLVNAYRSDALQKDSANPVAVKRQLNDNHLKLVKNRLESWI